MKRKLNELSAEKRLEHFHRDLRLLNRLTRVVHKKAIEADDNTAWGHLALKCLERRAAMLSLDGPVRTDLHLVAEMKRPSSSEAFRLALERMCNEGELSEESRLLAINKGFLPEPRDVTEVSDAESDIELSEKR